MALLQRSALSSKSAAASRRAAAPRVAFSSPIVAQLKQVRCQCSPASRIKLDTAPDRNKLLQNGQAISVPKQSVEQRSIKTQVCAVESINALRLFAIRAATISSVFCLQAAAVEAATVQAPSTYKKSEFELYTLTTWLLQARAATS